MEIRNTYIGRKNGVVGYYCGFKPDGLEVDEIREVLYPSEGYILRNKETLEEYDSMWLQNGDTQENYEEIEKPIEKEEE